MATIDVPGQVSVLADAEEALRKKCSSKEAIRLAYEDLYQEDLIKRLESELSEAVYRWILDPADRDAVLANVAIKKLSPDHHVIVEISCTRSPEELLAVRRAYQARYKHSLEEDVAAHTKGDTRKASRSDAWIFRALGSPCRPSEIAPTSIDITTSNRGGQSDSGGLRSSRDIKSLKVVGVWSQKCYLMIGSLAPLNLLIRWGRINTRVANSEAKILHEAVKDKEFNHEEIIRILSTRSKMQLMATFNRYRDDHGTTITKNLEGDSGDEFLKTLRATIRCLNDPKKYFEKVLRNSIRRVGTDEDALTRVIVTRAEKDLKDIKELYYKRNSVPLDQAVAKDTSGDYKACFLLCWEKKIEHLYLAHFQVSVKEDAEALRKACQGWGTDEKAIIAVLGRRNAAQRRQIRHVYEEIYQEDLIKRLESELSGHFEKAVYRWILDPPDRDAVLANVELKKSGNEHHVIVEISCTKNPEELLAIRRAYHARYKRSLEEDVAYHTKGDTRRLLVALVSAFRYYGEEINTTLAKSEAKKLHEAIKDKKFGNEDVIRILSTRSIAQLQATFNCYREEEGTSITKNLPKDSSDEYIAALRMAVRCLKDPKKFCGDRSRGLEPMRTLLRSDCYEGRKGPERNQELYHKRNNVPLDKAVDKETSGDYKDMLLTLLGNEV
ncbi:hypothetical protein CXB51_025433 [Gossypium anomalum]|uniref:Annexin n=1 Tax=Gossypium anomalum TaxID=47600 RepID=A0A8J5Y399_9ROSI|nr:hypothetical protein CXB51_025433 [Gossypium anomalum]